MNLKQRLQESTDPRAAELLRELEAIDYLKESIEMRAEVLLDPEKAIMEGAKTYCAAMDELIMPRPYPLHKRKEQ